MDSRRVYIYTSTRAYYTSTLCCLATGVLLSLHVPVIAVYVCKFAMLGGSLWWKMNFNSCHIFYQTVCSHVFNYLFVTCHSYHVLTAIITQVSKISRKPKTDFKTPTYISAKCHIHVYAYTAADWGRGRRGWFVSCGLWFYSLLPINQIPSPLILCFLLAPLIVQHRVTEVAEIFSAVLVMHACHKLEWITCADCMLKFSL